jgi:drug/metabolite transporter (DMT)-like permease
MGLVTLRSPLDTDAKSAQAVTIRKWLYLLTLSLIWGSSYILIKKGLEGFGYIEGATIRLMSAGIVALPLGLRYYKKIPHQKILLVLLSGLLSTFIPSYLFCLSQQHIQSSVAGILIAMTPSFTFLISVLFYRNAYMRTQVVGLFIGLFSSIVLSFAASSGLAISFNLYALLIVLATVCYGININLVKHYLRDVNPLHLSMVSVSLNGLLAFVFVFLPTHDQFQFTSGAVDPLLALLTLGIAGTAFAQLLHNKLIAVASPLFASAFTYLIPVIALAWGMLDQEVVTNIHFIAVFGILISVYLIRKEKKSG